LISKSANVNYFAILIYYLGDAGRLLGDAGRELRALGSLFPDEGSLFPDEGSLFPDEGSLFFCEDNVRTVGFAFAFVFFAIRRGLVFSLCANLFVLLGS
jgi:hypothetical protein